MSRNHTTAFLPLIAISCLILSIPLRVQAQAGAHARPLITQNIDESKLARLGGNTRPEATAANDRGIVTNSFLMDHMLLQLRRTPEQEQALKLFIDELHNPQSPNFHQWLTAQQFGERFGLAREDLAAITHWLESYGFKINVVYPSHVLIDFSGTAEQVRQAFHTQIHHLEVNGTSHIGNMRDPQIPAALAPAIVGVVSLHDFRPHPMVKMRGQYTFGNALTGEVYAVVPGDLATIYNFTPVFNSGITGQGQTIALVEDANLYSNDDWKTFRSTFGLSGYASGGLSTVHPNPPPGGGTNCSDPGVPGAMSDDGEATLDAEYSLAAAPGAAIQVASCASTPSTSGVLIAVQNLINASPPPPIISVSYGGCEAANGQTANGYFYNAYQQAVTEGVSVYVAAGDSGGAGCDQNQPAAANGIAVNALASTPYNVAVGGTDFGDTLAGTNPNYWNSGNTATYASALSYVPEIPWNASCASALLTGYLGYPNYGASSLCNLDGGLLAELVGVLTTAAGGGGPSNCASLSNTGSCVGYPKPSWQQVFGNPCGPSCGSSTNDGVRDLPDVSLFASNGVWSHYYIFCFSDAANGGTACNGAPSGWTGAGGTSFASPIMAGVQALINQKAGSSQGNPNPTLYGLANTEYGAAGNSSCNSSNPSGAAGSCIFYDLTLGDIGVDCTGSSNCFDYDPSVGNDYGVLSTSNSAYQPAFGTAPGWDFASGIGSVNVANLVNAWSGSSPTPNFTLSASPSSVTITQGAAGGSSTITITPTNGFASSVTLSASGLPSGVMATFTPNPAASTSTVTLTAGSTAATGTATVTITGMSSSPSLTHTTSLTLTVNAAPQPDFSLSASPTSVTITQGGLGANSTITVHPVNGFSSSVSFTVTSPLPSGVSESYSPNPATGSTTLTLSAVAGAATGTSTVTITGTFGSLVHTTSVTLTVNAGAPPDFSLSASPGSLTIARGHSGSTTITITLLNGFNSGVALTASGLPAGVSASFSPSSATTTSKLTIKVGSSVALATSTVTITGKSASLTHSTTVGLMVTRH